MKILGACFGCLIATVMLFASQAYGQGTVQGTVQLTLDDGSQVNAKMVRVLLTTTPVSVPLTPDFSGMDPYSRMERIRDLHMAFFINVRKAMAMKGYLADSTLTTPEGTFRFAGILPGKYFVVVTFPAMIDEYKVAWQVPVNIGPDSVAMLTLNNQNMAVPTYSRNKAPTQ
jgi:hypothetical protein